MRLCLDAGAPQCPRKRTRLLADLRRPVVELVAKLAPTLVLRLRRLLGDRLCDPPVLFLRRFCRLPCRSFDLPDGSFCVDGWIRVPRVRKAKQLGPEHAEVEVTVQTTHVRNTRSDPSQARIDRPASHAHPRRH